MTSRFLRHDWEPAPQAADGASAGNSAITPDEPASRIFPSAAPATDGGSLADAQPSVCTGTSSTLYVPEHCEPRYPYPLLVWLEHGPANSDEFHALMERVSPRNYLGLLIPSTASQASSREGEPFGADVQPVLENEVREAVRRVRRDYRVHSERIYVAGFGTAASLSLELLLHRPDWFAGAAAFGGGLPDGGTPLLRYRELRDKRVLLAAGIDSDATLQNVVRSARLLYTAGLSIAAHIPHEGMCDSAEKPADKLLRRLDEWLMQGIWSATPV